MRTYVGLTLPSAALLGNADASVVGVTFGFGPTLDDGQKGNFVVTGPSGTYGMLGAYNDGNYVVLPSSNDFPAYDAGWSYNDGSFTQPRVGGRAKLDFVDGNVIGGGAFGGPTGTPAGGSGAYLYHMFGGGSGPITGNKAGIIGFQTSAGNWGYADVSFVNGGPGSNVLTINEAFVESVPGTPITVPEPSTSALMLLCGGMVASARRRKKQKQAG